MATSSSIRIALILVLMPLTVGAASSSAEDAVAKRTAAEIMQMFKGVEQAQARGASVEQIADMEDADNITVVGEGEPVTAHGIPEAIVGVLKWRAVRDAAGPQLCTHELVGPIVASETIFSSFMLVNCKAKSPSTAKDTNARLLLTLEKLPQGWRIVHEMWASGTF